VPRLGARTRRCTRCANHTLQEQLGAARRRERRREMDRAACLGRVPSSARLLPHRPSSHSAPHFAGVSLTHLRPGCAQMADESTLLTGGKRSSRLGVLRVLCNEDKQLWFHPHELLETLGFGRANLARTLKRWAKTHGFGGDEEQPFASARLESIKVGDKTLLCLNKSGMHAILILLYDKPAALAVVTNRTVSKVARQLLSVDLGAEEEEEDDEEEEEAAAATEEESSAASSSSEEEADAAGLERVSFSAPARLTVRRWESLPSTCGWC